MKIQCRARESSSVYTTAISLSDCLQVCSLYMYFSGAIAVWHDLNFAVIRAGSECCSYACLWISLIFSSLFCN